MKIIVFLFFLFFLAGQSTAQATDTPKLSYNIDTLIKQGAVFVIDGLILEKPYRFNPDSIISITVINHEKAKEWFEGEARNGLVVMVSKHGAITSYQKKFCAFSKKYNEYLIVHENADNDILYVITDGRKPAVKGSSADLLRKLYEIQIKKIRKVQFFQGENTIMRYRYITIITTK